MNIIKQDLDSLKQNHVRIVRDHIKNNGLHLGHRWRLAEEDDEELVFRDMVGLANGLDNRFKFFKNSKKDV